MGATAPPLLSSTPALFPFSRFLPRSGCIEDTSLPLWLIIIIAGVPPVLIILCAIFCVCARRSSRRTTQEVNISAALISESELEGLLGDRESDELMRGTTERFDKSVKGGGFDKSVRGGNANGDSRSSVHGGRTASESTSGVDTSPTDSARPDGEGGKLKPPKPAPSKARLAWGRSGSVLSQSVAADAAQDIYYRGTQVQLRPFQPKPKVDPSAAVEDDLAARKSKSWARALTAARISSLLRPRAVAQDPDAVTAAAADGTAPDETESPRPAPKTAFSNGKDALAGPTTPVSLKSGLVSFGNPPESPEAQPAPAPADHGLPMINEDGDKEQNEKPRSRSIVRISDDPPVRRGLAQESPSGARSALNAPSPSCLCSACCFLWSAACAGGEGARPKLCGGHLNPCASFCPVSSFAPHSLCPRPSLAVNGGGRNSMMRHGAPTPKKSTKTIVGERQKPVSWQETNLMALWRLRHPNIVAIFGGTTVSNSLFLVEEAMIGGSLALLMGTSDGVSPARDILS